MRLPGVILEGGFILNRRSFLAVTAVAPLAAGVPLLLASPQPALAAGLPIESAARRYLGTADGRIYRSLGAEEPWSLSANFGKHCTVHQIRDLGESLEATIGIHGFDFTLRSSDGRVWRTPGRTPQHA